MIFAVFSFFCFDPNRELQFWPLKKLRFVSEVIQQYSASRKFVIVCHIICRVKPSNTKKYTSFLLNKNVGYLYKLYVIQILKYSYQKISDSL